MSGIHSIIPPSSAEIWGAPGGCTGWVLMSQTYPEIEGGEEALEGEASHEIGAALIDSATRGPTLPGPETFVGKPASNGIIYTDEMYEGARLYANDVSKVMQDRRIYGGALIGTEHKVRAPQIHELNEGTLDNFIFDRPNNELFLWDYKFGYIIHEAFENWQGIDYLAGLINDLNITGIDDQNIKVHFRIVQPRAFHRDGAIREWSFMLSDIRAHINTLHVNANIALSNDAVIHTGSHCYYCSARHACPAAIKVGMSLYEIALKPLPINLPSHALGVQYLIVKTALKRLESLESGLGEQVKILIKRGEIIPNWLLEMGRGRKAWNKPVAEVIQLGKMLGVNLKKPDDVKTPTQAEKLGIDPDVIRAYSDKPRTGLKLVPDNGNKARQAFK